MVGERGGPKVSERTDDRANSDRPVALAIVAGTPPISKEDIPSR
jgi:hypothetical protein